MLKLIKSLLRIGEPLILFNGEHATSNDQFYSAFIDEVNSLGVHLRFRKPFYEVKNVGDWEGHFFNNATNTQFLTYSSNSHSGKRINLREALALTPNNLQKLENKQGRIYSLDQLTTRIQKIDLDSRGGESNIATVYSIRTPNSFNYYANSGTKNIFRGLDIGSDSEITEPARFIERIVKSYAKMKF